MMFKTTRVVDVGFVTGWVWSWNAFVVPQLAKLDEACTASIPSMWLLEKGKSCFSEAV